MVVGNAAAKEVVWEALYPDTFADLLFHSDAAINTCVCMVLYNCVLNREDALADLATTVPGLKLMTVLLETLDVLEVCLIVH